MTPDRLLRRRRGPSDRSFSRGVTLLTLALFGVLTLWATLTPPFSTIDEGRHLNSVLRLVQDGGWPAPRTAPMLLATATAESEATLGPGRVGPPHDERSPVLGVLGPETGTPSIDWMNQHPPLYYGISAAVVEATDALTPGEQRWDTSLLVMRLVSALMTALALPFVARSLRLVTGSVPAALVGSSTLLLVPQLANTHSLVTNDSMVTLVGAALLWACLRAYVQPETLLSSSIVGGIVLGVGLLTKGLLLPAVPVIAVFLLLASRRAGPGWRRRFWVPCSAAPSPSSWVAGGGCATSCCTARSSRATTRPRARRRPSTATARSGA